MIEDIRRSAESKGYLLKKILRVVGILTPGAAEFVNLSSILAPHLFYPIGRLFC